MSGTYEKCPLPSHLMTVMRRLPECRYAIRRDPHLSPTPTTSPIEVDGVDDRSNWVDGVDDRAHALGRALRRVCYTMASGANSMTVRAASVTEPDSDG